MNKLDDKLIAAAESLVIIAGLQELILRLESDKTEQNKVLTDSTIAFIRITMKKFLKLSKTPVRKGVDGKLFPIIHDKN